MFLSFHSNYAHEDPVYDLKEDDEDSGILSDLFFCAYPPDEDLDPLIQYRVDSRYKRRLI